jgi:hypothetical protein
MASARHSGRVEERYVLEKPFGRDHSSCCEVRGGPLMTLDYL